MALEINALEAVKFGDVVEVPQIDAELQLRISELKFKTTEDIKEAKEILAEAFPINKTKILTYLQGANLPIFELLRLKTYLEGGEKAVKAYDDSFSVAVEKVLDKDA